MKNSVGQFEVVKIDQIVEIENFKNFYQVQSEESEEQLKNSVKSEGQLTPLVVTPDNTLLDGYRRLNLFRDLGYQEVNIQVVELKPTIDLRISLNTYRVKTELDLTNEVFQILSSIPKRQGKRPEGESYNRYEIIQRKLDYRWKSNTAIRQLDKIVENDFEDKLLLNGVVAKGWSLKDCERYIDDLKEIDLSKNYGFTDQLKKGGLNISQANKFIKEREFLANEYKDTFVIPEKSTSLRMNCCDIKNQIEFHSKVDTIMTSIPYWKLRFYENQEDYNQLGHEKTAQEFAAKIGDIFAELEVSLKKSSNIFVNIGDTYVDGCAMDVPDLVKRAILEKTNLVYKESLVWSKPNPKPINEAVKRPANKIEYILWFVVDPTEAKYNMITYTDRPKNIKVTNGAKDVDENGVVWDKVKSLSKPYRKIYNHISQQEVEHMIVCSTGKNIPISKAYSKGHPAAMSELLPVIPILMTTDENDLVYDPFAGGNTVGRIALLLNRNYLSTELSSHYHKIGCKVLENTLEEINQDDFNSLLDKVFDRQLDYAA
ncbi:DNA methyltransferase [Flavobacteriaceae bacterium]|jgi:DNA modification methylase|nr:DNA methyltransferase [Flavobacteriaceae bacterium]MDB4751590.1 DNA methyltransferase [Flavobacteriaceae bacterium]